MSACPLCLLGFSQPHSKKDWQLLAENKVLKERLKKIRKEGR